MLAGDVDLAVELVQACAQAGAWGVKLQALQPDAIASKLATPYWHTTRHADTQAESFAKAGTLDYADPGWARIFEAADKARVVPFATPFDEAAVDMLEALGAPCYKIASGDITNLSLLRRVAATARPVILSTGAATVEEVTEALAQLGSCFVVLLACTLTYPTPPEAARLGKVTALRDLWRAGFWGGQVIGVGYSDHTLGTWSAGYAVAAGAAMLEKHVTIPPGWTIGADRAVPDDDMAITPIALRTYCEAAAGAAGWLGLADLSADPSEDAARTGARRSLFFARNMRAGERIEADDLVALRPLVDGAYPANERAAVLGTVTNEPAKAANRWWRPHWRERVEHDRDEGRLRRPGGDGRRRLASAASAEPSPGRHRRHPRLRRSEWPLPADLRPAIDEDDHRRTPPVASATPARRRRSPRDVGGRHRRRSDTHPHRRQSGQRPRRLRPSSPGRAAHRTGAAGRRPRRHVFEADDVESLMRDIERDEATGFGGAGSEPDAPDEFGTFDDSDVETQHECPKCRYEWSGKA